MNLLAWPALILWRCRFWIGRRLEAQPYGPLRTMIGVAAGIIALPGLLFAAYYTKLMGEPIWLYQFRSMPHSEIAAGASGLLFGGLQGLVLRHPQVRQRLGKLLVPVVGLFTAALPFVKPLVGPLRDSIFAETWRDGVCLQSTPSTCGPASAATVLRHFGIAATERELARECFSIRTGTENWYLARALRRRGLDVRFAVSNPTNMRWDPPAIVGVTADGYGHFIPLLSITNGLVEVGDPLVGRERLKTEDLLAGRRLTGFQMTVWRPTH